MSIHIDALREIAANHGWWVCELAADEIEDMEKAYELLFEENSKNKQRAAVLEKALRRMVEAADTSDDCQYGTLSTSFVRDIANEALNGGGK